MIFGPYSEETTEQIKSILDKHEIPFIISVSEELIHKSHQEYAQKDGQIRPGGVHAPGFDYDSRAVMIEIHENYLAKLPPELEKFGVFYSAWEPDPKDFESTIDKNKIATTTNKGQKRLLFFTVPQLMLMVAAIIFLIITYFK